MSRSGYVDDYEYENINLWRGTVTRAIKGKRGQAFLREMLTALDAMPDKRLICDQLATADGEVCAIGSVGVARGMDMTKLDPEDYETVAARFGVACALVQEIAFINDDDFCSSLETPEQRWKRVRRWVAENITADR